MGGSASTPPKPALSEHSKQIVEEVKQHAVVIYTKDGCGYCVKAKNELYEDGITYTEKNLHTVAKVIPNPQEYINGLMDLTRQRTVPQIFICGKFVGGYTELNALRPNLANILETCSLDKGETLRREFASKI
ncbi:CRE-GLRX-22 protein [Caenorhabditis remanei]|uniref:CRE-GLRX-22 protein n=1 Tax=Caenorhabditis remanei TaxID=31234 RepID=E3M6Q0_CAERE|nr:CRE-GLRX-22 protein [Caenorhabditis remanei]